jgi:hypothetical protein
MIFANMLGIRGRRPQGSDQRVPYCGTFLNIDYSNLEKR